MEKPLITCSRCGGTGTTPLQKHLFETLCDIADLRECTSRDLCDRVNQRGEEDVTIPAMCNRLVRLVDLGLIERGWVEQPSGGYEYLYTLTQKGG